MLLVRLRLPVGSDPSPPFCQYALSPLEDWELWIHAVKKGWHFYHLPQVTFDYRVRPESLITRTYRAEFSEPLLNRLMTKHKDVYEPILIREFAAIKAQLWSIMWQTMGYHVANEVTLQALQSKMATLDQQIKEYQALSERLRERDAWLNDITSTRGWKLLRYYWDLKFSYLSPRRWLRRRRL